MSVLQEQRDPLQNYAVSLSLYETASQTQKVSEGSLFNLHGGEGLNRSVNITKVDVP